MAISYSNLPSLTFPSPITKNQFPFSIKSLSTKPPKRRRFEIRFSTSKNNEFRVREAVETRVGLVFPGGSWWSLGEEDDDDDDGNVESRTKSAPAKPITAVFALRRMWELISGDGRWAIFVGFGALVIAALSEISIPSVLTASIFSAQNGETVAFCRNSHFLLILCVTSGICSGLRSGCFAIANMILVMRLRETLYSSILFQDISFFDREAVGDLTSRLGADCQKLSHVIGNDVHLILRNTLQGTGALINLMTLSWPLALSALVICFILSMIFLFYGQYQKRAAKLIQEYTAAANEVAQETLSLTRTVRIYGTERKELGRYKQWLDKLAFVNIRESVAYGLWNMSFKTLYRSTQVIALLFGGMSILSGHVLPEQLTNPLEQVKRSSS